MLLKTRSSFLCLYAAAIMAPALVTAGESAVPTAQRGLDLKPGVGLQAKEVTPSCVATPLPTTPSGPTWSLELDTATDTRLRVTAWRQPCGGTDAQLMVTFEPLEGTPLVCGTEMEVLIGDVRSTSVFLLADPEAGLVSNFCDDLTAPATFVMRVAAFGAVFDDDSTFAIGYLSDLGPGVFVAIPEYDPSAYGDFSLMLAGKFSGSWFDPARNGEGALVEFGREGSRRVAFVAWYTYFEGGQRWLVGNADYQPGAKTVTVPLLLTSGGQFGMAFDPAQVETTPWGEVTLSLADCSAMRFEWSEDDGESGEFLYQRLVSSLDGVSCP